MIIIGVAYEKLDRKTKQISNQILRNYSTTDDDLYDNYDNLVNEAEQQKRTAKGHKERLKTLEKRDDFNEI